MTVDYPVRTPLLYWAVIGALVVLGLIGGGLLAWMAIRGVSSPMLGGLCLLIVFVPAIYYATTAEYRAAGVLRVAADEVTVPDPRGRPLRFAIPGLQLKATAVEVHVRIMRIPVAEVERGTVLDLTDGVRRRRISTLTLVDRTHKDALLEDLQRVLRGEPPRGPHLSEGPPAPPRPKSELEAQLDRELAALD
jgi:hypothetical protein